MSCSFQTARRPNSRSSTFELGACEGRRASPSNPNQPASTAGAATKPEAVFFYCSASEKALIRQAANERGLTMSAFLRQVATGAEPTRRRKIPRADPTLVLAVGCIGGNLNQIARWLNRSMLARGADLDALTVARRLLIIERQLTKLLKEARRC